MRVALNGEVTLMQDGGLVKLLRIHVHDLIELGVPALLPLFVHQY